MKFYKGLIIALFASSIFWGGVIKLAYSFGYEDGKAFQQYADNNKLESGNKVIANSYEK